MRRPARRASTRKHSIVIAGHKSSVSLEAQFWTAFKEMARREKRAFSDLAGAIDADRKSKQNLSSAIRCHILEDTMRRAKENEQLAMESEAAAEVLRRTVKSLLDDRDRAAKRQAGIAPIRTAIAASRANG